MFHEDLICAEETSADLQTNAVLLERVVEAVRAVHPEATPEEVCEWIDYGDFRGHKERYWTLDPVDGTKGFLRGQQYAICLALLVDGEVVVGVEGCPNLAPTEGMPPCRAAVSDSATPSEGAVVRLANSPHCLEGPRQSGVWRDATLPQSATPSVAPSSEGWVISGGGWVGVPRGAQPEPHDMYRTTPPLSLPPPCVCVRGNRGLARGLHAGAAGLVYLHCRKAPSACCSLFL